MVGQNLLAWIALCALAYLLYGRRGARVALALLALAGAYLPLLCLFTAAIEPSLLAERLIVGLGAPLLGALTLRLFGGWRALAVASLATVTAFAADLIAGTGLIPLSIPGPNPSGGSRFFGIGNEIEAIISALLPIGLGAALASPRRDQGRGPGGGAPLPRRRRRGGDRLRRGTVRRGRRRRDLDSDGDGGGGRGDASLSAWDRARPARSDRGGRWR